MMRRFLLLGALAAPLFAAGCGNFWQAPGTSTSTGGTTTTTALMASTTAPTVGASVTLTATVSPSAATGTVTFYSNSNSIGTGTLSSGTATLSTSFTNTGTYSLTATYGGSSTYASSTSSAVSATVSAATTSAQLPVAAATNEIRTTAYGSSPIDAAQAFSMEGGTYTAENADAITVRAGGSAALNGTALKSAAGAGYGVLLTHGSSDSDTAAAQFAMTGGSIRYDCGSTAVCQASAAGGEQPPAVFAVSDTKAQLTLTDVAVTQETASNAHREGTLLRAVQNGGSSLGTSVAFAAKGTSLSGDIVVDGGSAAAVELLADQTGTGSSLTGAINAADTAKAVNLALDSASVWTVTGTSYVGSLSGLLLDGSMVSNIDGGGHCVYYSGTVNGAGGVTYALSGGGFLAPKGAPGLVCH